MAKVIEDPARKEHVRALELLVHLSVQDAGGAGEKSQEQEDEAHIRR